jgi:hypothetical protein
MDVSKKPSECAPNISGDVCSTDDVINYMKKYIEYQTKKPFVGSKTDIIHVMTKLLDCDGTESCILSHPQFNAVADPKKLEQVKTERMMPYGPRDNTALLNNFNIDEVLDKYTNKIDDFHHINFRMIDFAETEPAEFSKKYNQGEPVENVKASLLTFLDPAFFRGQKKCMGVVLNTDIHTNGGKHWFALFFDFRNPNNITLEYFNSSGNIPMEEVHEYLIKFQRKVCRAYPNAKCTIERVSSVQLQNSKTECGVYSCYFVISRAEGISLRNFRDTCNMKGIPDSKMVEYRKHLFRKHK